MLVVSALLAVSNGGLWCYLWAHQWVFLVQVVSALLAVANGGLWCYLWAHQWDFLGEGGSALVVVAKGRTLREFCAS